MTWLRAVVLGMVVGTSVGVAGCGGDDGPGAERDTGPADMDGGSGDAAPGDECASDAECDDGTYCNGAELCSDGMAGPRRCVAGDPPDCDDGVGCTTDSCNEAEMACRHAAPDGDGDGHGDAACVDASGDPLGDDCDDTDMRRFPGNAEVCDGHDEDCNPDTLGFIDGDGDGSASSACCNDIVCGPDCNDSDATVRPGIPDGPAMNCDTIDNDCDGGPDEGCPCVDGETVVCGTEPELMMVGTCRPGMRFCVGGVLTDMCTGGVHPAEELCDELDNDCDGMTDDGVTRIYYVDADDDGFGAPDTMTTPATRACSAPAGYAPNPDDCNDSRAGVNPSGAETCDGIDNDCDGMSDEGLLRTFYRDADGDSFGTMTMTMTACSAPSGYVTSNTDCDDTRAAVNPGSAEACNGRDDDCDGATDTGCACTDGTTRMCGTTDVGACEYGTQRCVSGAWAECVGVVAPAPLESCNSLDDDCDGMTDEMVRNTYYRDADGDGFGAAATTMMACAAPAGYVAVGTDCADTDAARNPAAFERCDTVDNDCDGATDEGCTCTDGTTRACGTSMTGVCRRGTQQCVGGMWATCAGNIEPGTESCNGLDDDCDSMTDEMTTVACYADTDSDGYGAGAAVQRCPDPARTMFGMCPVGFSNVATDCNDASAGIRPGATEVCNGIDDNCTMGADEGLTVAGCYVDADGDTYGAGAATTQCRDATRMAAGFCPVGFYNRAMDCNDSRALSNPAAAEDCNGIDDDCDGTIDDGALNTYYLDGDRDGYGLAGMTRTGCTAPAGYVAASGDCNDGNASIYPGASEICDGVDQNCTLGTTDEPRRTFYRDADGDLYGTSGTTMMACTPPPGYVEYAGDCNDGNATIRPGATELCNGVDDDCEGGTDESAAAQCAGSNPFAVNVSSWACTAGACVANCSTSYGNCDATVANGCESDLRVNEFHCGMCGNACGVAGRCLASACDAVVDVVAGTNTTCVRRSNGRVACWGNGDGGELGDGRLADSNVPIANPDLFDIDGFITIARYTSSVHSFAYSEVNAALYGWGTNNFGQVGDGTTLSPRARPVTVTSTPARWRDVAGGFGASCGIRENGTGTPLDVVCWGRNLDGSLGYGDTDMNGVCDPFEHLSPPLGSPVAGSTGATDISAGYRFACMVNSAGGVRCWGRHDLGVIGNGMTVGRSCSPATVSLPFGFVATDVEAGPFGACAHNAAGTGYCWGQNDEGQVGNGTMTAAQATPVLISGGHAWAQFALGANHTCGRTTAGRIYCWGYASSGNLGIGTPAMANYPTPQPVGAATNWVDISAGAFHTCALNSLGNVYCWGSNNDGQLGDGTNTLRNTPTLVGAI